MNLEVKHTRLAFAILVWQNYSFEVILSGASQEIQVYCIINPLGTHNKITYFFLLLIAFIVSIVKPFLFPLLKRPKLISKEFIYFPCN